MSVSEAMSVMPNSPAGKPKSSDLNDGHSESAMETSQERQEMAEKLILATPSNTASRDIETQSTTPPISRPYGGPLAPGGRNPPKFLAGPALWFMFAAQALTGLTVTLYVMIIATVSADRHVQ